MSETPARATSSSHPDSFLVRLIDTPLVRLVLRELLKNREIVDREIYSSILRLELAATFVPICHDIT